MVVVVVVVVELAVTGVWPVGVWSVVVVGGVLAGSLESRYQPPAITIITAMIPIVFPSIRIIY